MNRNYFYLIAGLTALCSAFILSYFISQKKEPQQTYAFEVTNPLFLNYISGSGIVEPASGNIMISSPLNRIVEKINTSVTDEVNKGDILFQLYNEDLKALLKIKQKKYEESLANLDKLKAFPQREDFIIAQENLNRNQALLNQSFIEHCLTKKMARTKEEKCISLYKYQQIEAEFLQAQAQWDKVRWGTWQPDLEIAKLVVEQAKADVEATEAEIEQTYIKSPIKGTVLQVKIHEGELLDPSKTAVIVGNIEELNIRVQIDQLNEKRFRSENLAVAFKQGNSRIEIPLKFLYVEPIMVQKKYLVSELHERVDTQVFEIVYRIEKNNLRLFIGEQMDVFICVKKK